MRPCFGAKQVLVCSIICVGLLFKASTWSVQLYICSVLHPKLKCCPKLNFRLSNLLCFYRTYDHSSHIILPLCISCTVGPKECAILIFCPLKPTTLPPSLPPSLCVCGGSKGGREGCWSSRLYNHTAASELFQPLAQILQERAAVPHWLQPKLMYAC